MHTASTTHATAKLQAIRSELRTRFRLRDAEIDGILCSLLARANVLLVGSRGDGKTALVRAVAGYLQDASFFHLGMHKQTTEDHLFGGPDLVALQAGRFQRDMAGKLADCHVALLDEYEKTTTGTSNALLVPLEDRLFEGRRMPLQLVVAAGNALVHELRNQTGGKALALRPGEDSLLPFVDRFLFRFCVASLQPGTPAWRDVVFRNVTSSTQAAPLSLDELSHLQAAVHHVAFPVEVADALEAMAVALALGNGSKDSVVQVSVRTYAKLPHLLRAWALLQGRTTVAVADLAMLQHVLWTTPDQRQLVLQAALEVGSKVVLACSDTVDTCATLVAAFLDGRAYTTSDSASTGALHHVAPGTALPAGATTVGAGELVLRRLRKEQDYVQQLATTGTSSEDAEAVARATATLDVLYQQAMDHLSQRMFGAARARLSAVQPAC